MGKRNVRQRVSTCASLQHMSRFLLALVLLALAAPSLAASRKDLLRAKTAVPRNHYKGAPSLVQTNMVLNGHLHRMSNLATQPCEVFSIRQLQDLSLALFTSADSSLLEVYHQVTDNRRQIFGSVTELEQEYTRLSDLVLGKDDLSAVLRDGMCHRVVMWFVHHLSAEKQAELIQVGIKLPLLPKAEHTGDLTAIAADDTSKAVHEAYDKSITCQACHVGGIDSLHVNEVFPSTPKQLARRCYTDYKELFNVTCGPCDGIAGTYWGDDDEKYFDPDPCEIVSQPSDVAEADRVQPVFPPQFSVEVVAGSDRWGRTTNPSGHVKTPFPPLIDSMYGQISGNWFVNVMPDSDLWMLRHDTSYKKVSFNGTTIPFIGFHVSEIHGQTRKQQSVNNTGQMVSLISGIPSFIPGGCTCVADPVGVPDVAHERTSGLDEMEYLGRIKLTLKEHTGEVVLVDHWANWFFHVFMEVDKTVPHYGKAPVRLASAYAGTATYANWVLHDPAIADPTVWNRGIPTSPERVGPDHGKYCLNPQKIDMCSNITSKNWPPQPEAPDTEVKPLQSLSWRAVHQHFLPSGTKPTNM